MIVNRQQLCSVLDILKVAVGNKVMIVSDYIRFAIDIDNRAVYLSTTNFNAHMVMSLTNVDFEDTNVPKDFLINALKLLGIVKASTTEVVEFKLNKDGCAIVVITNGQYKFNLFSDAQAFPVVNFDSERIGTYKAAELKEIWNLASIAITRDVTQLRYQGVNFDGNWSSTDNRRMACVVKDNDYTGRCAILPPVFGDVLKYCKGDVDFGITVDNTTAILCDSSIGLIASVRLLSTEFVKYKAMLMMRKLNITVYVSKSNLLGSLKRLDILTEKQFKVIKLCVGYSDHDEVETVDLIVTLESESNESGTECISIPKWNFSDDIKPGIYQFNYQIENFIDGVNAIDCSEDDLMSLDLQESGLLFMSSGDFQYLLSNVIV